MFEHEHHPGRSIARARGLRQSAGLAEQRLWRELRKLDAKVRRQVPIGPYVADFAVHAAKLVIEVDGEVHERLAAVAAKDLQRTAWLTAEGYRLIRFTNDQVLGDISGVVEQVREALSLEGRGLGEGVSAEMTSISRSAPNSANRPDALRSPSSPALLPSREKGV